jgi:hypothetical protein
MKKSTPSTYSVFKGIILLFKKAKLCCAYFNTSKINDNLEGYLKLEWRTNTPTDLNKFKIHNFEAHTENQNQFVFPYEKRRNIF